MKIVFLDTTTIGDKISLDSIAREGDLKIYKVTSPTEIAARIKEADVVLTNKVAINIGAQELTQVKKLKLICVVATGYNNVDLQAAKQKNIVVTNVAGYSTDAVAQTVFAYILNFYNLVPKYDQAVKKGEWSKSHIFALLKYNITELAGKTLGIIGYGIIGQRVAKIARSFGVKVITTSRSETKYNEGFRVELPELLAQSDVITIHTPLTPETENLIGASELEMMKPEAILINAARGGIVNEDDLYQALKQKKIKAAALDVMAEEPPRQGSKLFELDNIIITPHIAWATRESRQRLIEGVAENIRKFKAGKAAEIDLCRQIKN
ncbi:D-2-hydroxyacid dehydrogenase [Patescibacteria group bacterium]|nr:D-2-hydroxyacid dehydrogenase [Patescibacteria group bacterium]